MTPDQWLWCLRLKGKIETGIAINLNGSRMGRDSVFMLLIFAQRIIENTPKKVIWENLEECDRSDWISYWFLSGESPQQIAAELEISAAEVEAIVREKL